MPRKKKTREIKEKVIFESLDELEKYFAREKPRKEPSEKIDSSRQKGTGLARTFLQNF